MNRGSGSYSHKHTHTPEQLFYSVVTEAAAVGGQAEINTEVQLLHISVIDLNPFFYSSSARSVSMTVIAILCTVKDTFSTDCRIVALSFHFGSAQPGISCSYIGLCHSVDVSV